MSTHYQAVNWNPQKRIYDALLALGVVLFLAAYLGVDFILNPNVTVETALIRSFGLGALVLLHVILCIGPLCRLDPRFLPLLYNRRHLGVSMFLLALAHAGFATVQYHALGDLPILESLLTASGRFDALSRVPFELLGVAALGILLLMAATSHDFWLAVLTPRVWKALHMLVYVAYALVIAHVAFGALQAQQSPWLLLGLAGGAATVVTLHLIAGFRESRRDRPAVVGSDGWIDVGAVDELEEGRAVSRRVGDERVAVVRHAGGISCLSGVCRHQGGPLGEGRIVNGCLTCPWHGYQYLPDSGQSPPPFTEKVATYRVRVRAGRVEVHTIANPPGTPVTPARVNGNERAHRE